jgi:ATP-dependent Clp protease ATP-binding subunit ClpC
MEQFKQLEKFSQHFKNSIKSAGWLAGKLGNNLVEPTHLFYGLTTERGSIAGEFLLNLQFSPEAIKSELEIKLSGSLSDQLKTPNLSEKSKEAIIKSIKLAYQYGHNYIGTEQLFTALLEINDPVIKQLIEVKGLSISQLKQQALLILKTTAKLPEILEDFREDGDRNETEEKDKETKNILDYFGRNLTALTCQKKIDPVIGREAEIKRIIEILCRRSKNNPLLIGEPGVGKTAIVEGLAKKILAGDVPPVLADKKIYLLDLASVVAGTSFRGEFESRLKDIIAEVENRDDIIIFIDEIHQIVGGGSASGSMDAANILKPALARGELKVIGATTYSDYRKSIENDRALARRFQPIKIEEPTPQQTKQILEGVRGYLENFHQVRISSEAIDASVELSCRYLSEKFLPDKAIDLIDEAAASIKANRKPGKTEESIKVATKKASELEKSLHELIIQEDFNQALELKTELQQIEKKLEKINLQLKREKLKKSSELKEKDISRVLTGITGIPLNEAILPVKNRIITLEKNLKNEIIGQDQALNNLLKHLKSAIVGLNDENRPLASLLLAGPSGVGKTYTAQLLAREFFGSENALLRLDMSEYGEKFNASKLIGAPAGYVGYKESGQLTERIKRQPYSLILFDEIEKADKNIFDLLLQVLDNGYLTDAVGDKINFRNTIIVLTSNLGSELLANKRNIGFENNNVKNSETLIAREIKNHFRPEFLNRLDDIVYFNQLDTGHLKQVAKLELGRIINKLEQKIASKIKTETNIVDQLIELITTKTETNLNARTIKTQIKPLLENILIETLINEKKNKNKILRLKAKNGIITLT